MHTPRSGVELCRWGVDDSGGGRGGASFYSAPRRLYRVEHCRFGTVGCFVKTKRGWWVMGLLLKDLSGHRLVSRRLCFEPVDESRKSAISSHRSRYVSNSGILLKFTRPHSSVRGAASMTAIGTTKYSGSRTVPVPSFFPY